MGNFVGRRGHVACEMACSVGPMQRDETAPMSPSEFYAGGISRFPACDG